MLDLNKLCMGCMRETEGEKYCQYCDFSLEEYNKERSSCALPVYTILNGKYLVGKVLGIGGFGITYLAYDLNLQISVAIKEYFPSGIAFRNTKESDSTQVQVTGKENYEYYTYQLRKFRQEGITLAKFQEMKGVVSVINFFMENETGYLVMEFIDGIQMKDYLRQQGGRLSEEVTLSMMRPLLEMLARVHKEGIVHRDISADNIMITANQEVKLIDFGAARQTTNLNGKSLTVLLKHGYAPVEQYQTDGNQGPWTDVYAVCALMYRMISGKLPVTATNRVQKDLLQPLAETEGIRVSRRTSETIQKGLAVWAENRYQDVGALIEDLYGTEKTLRERENGSVDKAEAGNGNPAEKEQQTEPGKPHKMVNRLTAGAIAFAGFFTVLVIGMILFTKIQPKGALHAFYEGIAGIFTEKEAPGETEPEAEEEPVVENPEIIGYADMIFGGTGNQEIRELSGSPVKLDAAHKIELLAEDGAAAMLDNDETTGWKIVSGSTKAEMTFEGEREVEYLTLKLGEWGNEKEFRASSRPQRMKICLGEMNFEIGFKDEYRKCYLQICPPVSCSSMSVQVISNYVGAQTGESCISELEVYGGYEQ